MLASFWVLAVVVTASGQDPQPRVSPPTTSAIADAITFRDGKVLLGQVVESSDRRGPVLILARRAWVEANLADRAATWEKAEAPMIRQAEALRRERLVAWRRTRPDVVEPSDKITPWLDAAIAAMPAHAAGKTDVPTAKTPLMLIRVARNTIKTLDHKPKTTGRLLRLAWTMSFPDPEAMTLDDLKQGLEDKGFSAASDAPVSVDTLLPTPLETEEQWLVRRAATEMTNLPGGRFISYGGAVMPEPAPGEAPPVGAAMEALSSTLKDLLGEGKQANPLPGKFRELANQGRIGALVTSMEMTPDMASTTVSMTLWVSPGHNREWVPALNRSSTVRPGDLPADAGANLAEAPQIKAVLGMISSLGLGDIPPELKQRSLNMGSASQKAIGEARSAMNKELANLALPVDVPRIEPTPAPKP